MTMRGLAEAGGEHEPALPMAVRAFYVPEGYEVREIRAIPREEVRVAEGLHLSVREAALEKDPAAVTRPFPAGAIESGSPRHPARSAVSVASGSLAGHRIHSIALFPVRWNPTTEELTFTRAFDVEIDLVPASSSSDLVRLRPSPARDREFRTILAALIENPEDLPAVTPVNGVEGSRAAGGGFAPGDLPSVDGSAVDMVIVTTAALEADFPAARRLEDEEGRADGVRTVELDRPELPERATTRPSGSGSSCVTPTRSGGRTCCSWAATSRRCTPRPRSTGTSSWAGPTSRPTSTSPAWTGDWNADGDASVRRGHHEHGAGRRRGPDAGPLRRARAGRDARRGAPRSWRSR